MGSFAAGRYAGGEAENLGDRTSRSGWALVGAVSMDQRGEVEQWLRECWRGGTWARLGAAEGPAHFDITYLCRVQPAGGRARGRTKSGRTSGRSAPDLSGDDYGQAYLMPHPVDT